MKKEIYSLWPADPRVTLTVFHPETEERERPTVIVIPGGAYLAPAAREADPVAEHFAGKGYLGCVLRASTLYASHDDTAGPANPHTVFPEPLQELAEAIRFLRRHGEEFGLSRRRIAVMGFSAGGHLASVYGNCWNQGALAGLEACDAEEIRPDAQVLCYAVTRLTKERPGAMLRAVYGEGAAPTEEMLERYSAVQTVNEDTPPTFLWHTSDDGMVPASQSVAMASALLEKGICCEAHLFDHGRHAGALASGLSAEPWSDLADAFLRRTFA